jgi:hypothetical protein
MIEMVVSGGQTGADQAGWFAADACNIATGGYMIRDAMTEAGPAVLLASYFCAEILNTDHYPTRTRRNVQESHGTILFGNLDSKGSRLATELCEKFGRPLYRVIPGETKPSDVAEWIAQNEIRILNVAGNRASQAPMDFFDRVKRFLIAVFKLTNKHAFLSEDTPCPGTSDRS